MFYLLHICSCLILCSEIPFSESLCFTGTSQLVSSVFDLSRFCLVWLFTHFNLRTHFRAIFVLCAPIDERLCYNLTAIRFSTTDVLSYQEGFHLFAFHAGQLSSVAWRKSCILQQCTGII